MKTFLRFIIATAFLLMMELGCFAQHYNQTNLVSNTSGATPVTDPQLINPWGLSRGSGSASLHNSAVVETTMAREGYSVISHQFLRSLQKGMTNSPSNS